MADPCEHEDFDVFAVMHRLTEDDRADAPVIGYSLELGVACHLCSGRFAFRGLPVGVSSSQPTVSLDGQTLRAPMRPVSAPEEFGLDVPGFRITVRDPGTPPGTFGPGPVSPSLYEAFSFEWCPPLPPHHKPPR